MAEVIQFHCPACGISLRVPPAAAGFRGPCPRCRQEIIGPDPDLGLEARRADAGPAPPPETRHPEDDLPAPAFPNFTDPEPPFSSRSPDFSPAASTATTGIAPPEKQAPPAEAPRPAAPEPSPPAPAPDLRRTVLVLSVLVAALAGLMAGFLVGINQSPEPPQAPAAPPAAASPSNPPPPSEAGDPPPAPEEETPKEPDPAPTPPEPEPTPPAPQPDQSKAEPAPASPEAPAESALKAFLAAPDWRSRAEFVLHPGRIREKMKAYHEETPDGPTVATSIRVDAKRAEPDQAVHLYSFQVATREFPDGFPVAVVETPAGWKVDWETFVEFRDDHFQRFATGEGSELGAFHVLVRNTHYFGEKFPGIENLTAFRIDPPQPDRTHYAFVPTDSDLHKLLAGSTEWGAPCAPVLELVRKPREDGKFHLEITGIIAPNWRPALH